MTPKSSIHVIQGMQKDTSKSKVGKEFAFNNHNIRITAREDNTLLTITNEKGTSKHDTFPGTYLGHCVLQDQLVLFYKHEDKDYISVHDGTTLTELYSGNLNFSLDNPIETLGVYETEFIQKVYWIDGINQPRVINIKEKDDKKEKWNEGSFNFVRDLKLEETISIEVIPNSSGFASGIIQYAFSYYKKYGQESNIFDVSPLCYITHKDRGASPEDIIKDTAFKIKVNNLDYNFDYIRIYSIHRTSLNAVPTVRKVVDLPINKLPEVIETKGKSNSFSIVSSETGGANYYYDGIPLKDSKLIISCKTDGVGGKTTCICDFLKILPLRHKIIEVRDGNKVINTIEIQGNTFNFITSTEGDRKIKYQTISTENYSSELLITKFIENPDPTSNISVEYIDNGILGEDLDPTTLFYIGGENIIPNTFTHKDGTLFFGNIKSTTPVISEEIKNYFRTKYSNIKTCYKNIRINNKSEYSYAAEEGNRINEDSYFKPGEIYRLGIQFQYSNGKWSEPIYIGDITQSLYDRPIKSINTLQIPIFKLPITNDIRNKLAELNVKKLRGLVVYPDYFDRIVLAQGILCPTVYNHDNRAKNNPYSQSSWLLRPNIYEEITDDAFADNNVGYNIQRGARVEFRHGRSLTTGANRGAEVQNYVDFKVDQSILTFHSPEVELDELNTYDNAKLRIVGIVPFNSNYGDIDIQINGSSGVVGAAGFYKYNVADEDYGDRSLVSGTFYETWYNWPRPTPQDPDDYEYGLVYLWQRSGSLGPENYSGEEENITPRSVLKNKKISNIKLSKSNIWLDKNHIWEALGGCIGEDSYANGISKIEKFSSNQVSLSKIQLDNKTVNYFGNIDTLLTTEASYTILHADTPFGELKKTQNSSKDVTVRDPVRMKYKSSPHLVFALNKAEKNNHTIVLPTLDGLNSINNTIVNEDVNVDTKNIKYIAYKYEYNLGNTQPSTWQPGDIIAMPHYYNYEILEFWIVSEEGKLIQYRPEEVTWLYYKIPNSDLVEVYEPIGNTWYYHSTINMNTLEEDDDNVTRYKQDSINIENPALSSKAYLYLAELYRENDESTIFGGITDNAIQNNLWTPAGKSTSIDSDEMYFEYGDTRYQRYDCLKTYAFTPEDENQVIEVASFLCETRVNLLGRYDRNIGSKTYLNVDNTNLNTINPVYNQKDNFFSYRILDSDIYKLKDFDMTITWSKEKHNAEDVDTWTNITMANTLDLDGTKGKINKIITTSNNILAFQDKGIADILFNSRVQIPISDGVPIEISNGYKVDGFRYISDTVGCKNKHSIQITPSGVYFLDSESNGIYLLADGLKNISTEKGFDIWTKEVANDPTFKTFYDKNNKDVYFNTDTYSLCYSEKLGNFISFYDYNGVDTMFNIENGFYSIKNKDNYCTIHRMFEGDYNNFFGELKPYSITLISNEDPYIDKIFTNIEYQVDMYDSNNKYLENESFDTLEVWNEYQQNKIPLVYSKYKPSSLKKRFRLWDAIIPRDKTNKLDRMRNPWLFIKLSKEKPGTSKMELHDIAVKYFE